jgi:hypothetical protein
MPHREKKDLKRGKEETAIKAVLADRRMGVLGSIPTTAKREWSSFLCLGPRVRHKPFSILRMQKENAYPFRPIFKWFMNVLVNDAYRCKD